MTNNPKVIMDEFFGTIIIQDMMWHHDVAITIHQS